MASLKEIYEKAQSTGKVEYNYFGGSSSRPFNQTSIGFGDDSQPYIRLGYDPTLKYTAKDPTNSINKGLAILRDEARISRFLTDFPDGPLWLGKQSTLHLSNPDMSLEGSRLPIGNDIIGNTLSNFINQDNSPRTYNPLGVSTLASVGGTGLGVHFTKHGFDFRNGIGYLELNKVTTLKDIEENGQIGSRLKEYNRRLQGVNDFITLNKTIAGPDSTYGVGSTIINSYANTFGLNNGTTNKDGYVEIQRQREVTLVPENDLALGTEFTPDGAITATETYAGSVPDKINRGFLPFSYENINSYGDENKIKVDEKGKVVNSSYPKDFRITKKGSPSDNYPDFNIHNRVGVTSNNSSIGNTNTVDSIQMLRITKSETFFKKSNSATKGIIAEDIYVKGFKNEDVDKKITGYYGRDLVKFRIEVLNNNQPNVGNQINTDVLAFRAYINNFTDNFSSNWKDFNYMGRGEKFYTYQNFTRNIGVGFKLFAHSAQEMSIMYTKLNYLMSVMAPDYTRYGQMRGNYVYLTIGDYMYRQPGVFTSLNVGGILDAPWEIAVNEPENSLSIPTGQEGTNDKTQYEVPKLLNIDLQFNPIHNFLPRRMYGEDQDHPATFVTPNHHVGTGYNRYLPSTIRVQENNNSPSGDNITPTTPSLEGLPQRVSSLGF